MRKFKLTKEKTNFIMAKSVFAQDKSCVLIQLGYDCFMNIRGCHENTNIIEMENIIKPESEERKHLIWLPEDLFDNDSFQEEFAVNAVNGYSYVELTNKEYNNIKTFHLRNYLLFITKIEYPGSPFFGFQINVKDKNYSRIHTFTTCLFDKNEFKH